ncbi:MAG: Rmt family 16S rRNA (guanine(1405)-N(7))-methyltransferase [Clostridia bacterium]|nr:Rmt family 16S rRNA (guanine(1405)-N(7))-methyltransferase [Clostridia bacterium]
MTETEALDRLLGAKNLRDICPDTVKRVFERQLKAYKTPAEAEKAARVRLHALTGAFMTSKEFKSARACLARYADGDESALSDALRLHSSTCERMEYAQALYERITSLTGTPDSVYDAACGINPLYLGAAGFPRVRGADINNGAVSLVNDWAEAAGWDVRADCADVNVSLPEERWKLALAFKLLPVLETNEKGSALRLMERLNAEYIAVSFPTRTLSGRGAGMEKHYSEFFERETDGKFRILDRFTAGSELVYVVSRL